MLFSHAILQISHRSRGMFDGGDPATQKGLGRQSQHVDIVAGCGIGDDCGKRGDRK